MYKFEIHRISLVPSKEYFEETKQNQKFEDSESTESESVRDENYDFPKQIEDNKGMVNAAPSDRTSSPTARVNIPATPVVDKTPNKQSTKIRLRKRITVPFLSNLIVALTVLALLILLEYGFIPGNKLGFYCQDPLISHKYKGEVISPLILGLGSLLIPLLALIAGEVLSKKTFKKINYREIWYYYRECATGCILVLLLTEVAKILVGEHRPHFFDVCAPDTAKNCLPSEYIDTYTCTNPNYSKYFLVDSSRSFPSGHSSISWFIGTFSAYVIQTRLSTIYTGRLLKPFLIAICFSWSFLCSMTRITDRRHHWWDVLAGSALGILGAFYTIKLVHKKIFGTDEITKVSTSTTTLLDIKNKDATSVII
ncbi:phospholipid phosphatase 1-like isoform X2 [Diorhabda sublineata]|uniref:phospholipid phosphatase 1-like isoform X2 n=1 Tax=Diorhabda sublineata TaxID=1163346 RepID=UPI0024E11010|nr:phospholipid phosphatase 1-like isoform X2 [Diorhabda sublineata]